MLAEPGCSSANDCALKLDVPLRIHLCFKQTRSLKPWWSRNFVTQSPFGFLWLKFSFQLLDTGRRGAGSLEDLPRESCLEQLSRFTPCLQIENTGSEAEGCSPAVLLPDGVVLSQLVEAPLKRGVTSESKVPWAEGAGREGWMKLPCEGWHLLAMFCSINRRCGPSLSWV